MVKHIKATKLDVLEYIKYNGLIEVWQLREHSRYTDASAAKRLSLLKKQRLVINMTKGMWELTGEGNRKLSFFGRD